MTTSVDKILKPLDDLRGDVEDLYRDLHSHPELSHHETRTAAKAAQWLKDAGYEVTTGIGGTGVVGVLRNGDGPTVLLRADMDALPVREDTGLDYASHVTVEDDGVSVPVMHACGHDVHVASLAGAATLLARGREHWSGTVVALFQPAEEVADGAQTMIDDGLTDKVPSPDVALAQHVLVFPAGQVGTRTGTVLSAADSLRVTIHGRGAHGSMPQSAVDPVVVAGSIIVQLQEIVARFVAPSDPAVVTVGSVKAGSKSNVIPDTAELLINIRTYTQESRRTVLDAVGRIVRAACDVAGCPQDPDIEQYDTYPLTVNDSDVTDTVAAAFKDQFGDDATELPLQSASEDFSDLPKAFGVPYTFWGLGGVDPKVYAKAEKDGKVSQLPVNHSAQFAPVIQPTLDTGVSAMVTAAVACLQVTK